MTIHFAADTHFDHRNIINFCNRPFSGIEEMNEALIDNWNRTVKITDTVYILGDFCMRNSQQRWHDLLVRLNGKIHFIHGNHDKAFKKKWAEEFLAYGLIESYQDYLEINMDRYPIILFHYPIRSWDKCMHGSIHLFGHVHGKVPSYFRAVDVGVDNHEITSDYRPVSWQEVKDFILNK